MSLDWLLEYSLHPNAAVLVGGIVFAVICLSWILNRKQIYAPGVPIYGGSDDVSLKKNRMRFVHDSKSMLLEGYWQVSKKKRLPLPVCLREHIKFEVLLLTYQCTE